MKNEQLDVAFRLNGGIGTFIAEANFICGFYRKFSDEVSISIYASAPGQDNPEEINEGIFGGQEFAQHVYLRRDFREKEHDLSIDLNWFPKILHCRGERLSLAGSELQEVVATWVNFRDNDRTKRLLEVGTNYFQANVYTYGKIMGKNRLTMPDIDGRLGLGKSFVFQMKIRKDEGEVLSRLGLQGVQYITFQCGVSASCGTMASPRQWLPQRYEEVCRLLKSAYPHLKLVQLGQSKSSQKIFSADVSLLDRTNFEELKVVLKHALIHIDGDTGNMHIRRVVCGRPSVIVYGQTTEVSGYDEDVHIRTDACGIPCISLFEGWKKRCYLGDVPLCMVSISAEMVFEECRKILENDGRKLKPTEKITPLDALLANPKVELDEEWKQGWLLKQEVLGWQIKKTRLSDLRANILTSQGDKVMPLENTPHFIALTQDPSAYTKYIELNKAYRPGNERSLARAKSLRSSLEGGVDLKKMIVIGRDEIIMDGLHRASYLMAQRGGDYCVDVLKIYWIPKAKERLFCS